MKTSQFSALICGYGIPKDIMTDENYFSYLTQVFNFLFDRFADTKGSIVLSGGATDCFPPFKRTEAREMKRWLVEKIKNVEKETQKKILWKIILDNKALSTLENLVNFEPFAKGEALIFAEKTRTDRIKRLAKIIFKNQAKCIFFDFDGSFARYHKEAIQVREKNALVAHLAAVKDRSKIKDIRQAVQRRLSLMRKYGSEEGLRIWLGVGEKR
ncbi:MAG: ElyC/SanA/YdcF family protein [Candidatus Uhrbacteria bacterium]